MGTSGTSAAGDNFRMPAVAIHRRLLHIFPMAKARIYQPDKTAMQSGKAKTLAWLFEFAPEKPYFIDNLMGWNGMTDMPQEIRLSFPTKEAAVAFAERQRIPYEVELPHKRRKLRKAYADNFKYNRING
jgi:hypothetical protein